MDTITGELEHVERLRAALQKDADADKIVNKLWKHGCDQDHLRVGISFLGTGESGYDPSSSKSIRKSTLVKQNHGR
jgi:hypothetical protein